MYFSGMKRGTLFFFSLLLVLMAHGKPELVNPSETGYGVEFAKELNLEAPPLQAGQVRWVLKVLGEDSKSAELQMTALVDKGWHLYSQKNPPNPTGFELSINGKALGQMEFKEPKAVEEEDGIWVLWPILKSIRLFFPKRWICVPTKVLWILR